MHLVESKFRPSSSLRGVQARASDLINQGRLIACYIQLLYLKNRETWLGVSPLTIFMVSMSGSFTKPFAGYKPG